MKKRPLSRALKIFLVIALAFSMAAMVAATDRSSSSVALSGERGMPLFPAGHGSSFTESNPGHGNGIDESGTIAISAIYGNITVDAQRRTLEWPPTPSWARYITPNLAPNLTPHSTPSLSARTSKQTSNLAPNKAPAPIPPFAPIPPPGHFPRPIPVLQPATVLQPAPATQPAPNTDLAAESPPAPMEGCCGLCGIGGIGGFGTDYQYGLETAIDEPDIPLSGTPPAGNPPAADKSIEYLMKISGYDRIMCKSSRLQAGTGQSITMGSTPHIAFAGVSIPLLAPSGAPSWAVLNLALTSSGVLYAVAVSARALYRRRRGPHPGHGDRDAGGDGNGPAAREDPAKAQLRPAWLATSIGLAALGAGMFLHTQDIGGGVMTLFDGNTPTLVLILAAEIAAVNLVFKERTAAPQH